MYFVSAPIGNILDITTIGAFSSKHALTATNKIKANLLRPFEMV
jgi:hypothetical protein